jgi:hypothetical protein
MDVDLQGNTVAAPQHGGNYSAPASSDWQTDICSIIVWVGAKQVEIGETFRLDSRLSHLVLVLSKALLHIDSIPQSVTGNKITKQRSNEHALLVRQSLYLN